MRGRRIQECHDDSSGGRGRLHTKSGHPQGFGNDSPDLSCTARGVNPEQSSVLPISLTVYLTDPATSFDKTLRYGRQEMIVEVLPSER